MSRDARLPTFLLFDTLSPRSRTPLPRELRTDDTRGPEPLARLLMERFSRRGSVVLDPFAGFGGTLQLAERLGRKAYGVESDPARAAYSRTLLHTPGHLVTGDAKDLLSFGFPKFDLCLTSPPYVGRDDPLNPLSSSGMGGYRRYFVDLARIFHKVRELAKPGAHVVVEVANLRIDRRNRPDRVATRLAWDVAACLARFFRFEGEIVVGWKGKALYRHGGTYGYGYDHNYVLVFGMER